MQVGRGCEIERKRQFLFAMVCAILGASADGPAVSTEWQQEGVTPRCDESVNWTAASFGTWVEILPPDGRVDHVAVYDPLRTRMIVFGGAQKKTPYCPNDVWSLSLDGTAAWTQLNPTGSPPSGRVDHTAIYDPIGDRIIMFGGTSGSNQNDVWALSLSGTPGWSELTPVGTPPPARRDHTAIYDPAHARMIIFGGVGGAYLNDVFVLSLGETPVWTALSPSGAPPGGRWGHTAVYNMTDTTMVVFGGTDGAFLNDLWTLTLGPSPVWAEIVPAGTPPSGRADHTAVYDPVGNRMIVFAEWDGKIMLANDVWELSLGASPTWTEIVPSGTMPSGRWGHTAVYHSDRQEMIVHGGFPNYANDVWAFNLCGSPGWTELTPVGSPPVGRAFHAAVYDPVRDQMVVTGGYPLFGHDVWVLPLEGSQGWTRLSPAGTPPTGRKNHSAIYDPAGDRVLIFGGFLTYPDNPNLPNSLNDLWELRLGVNPEWNELFSAGPLPSARDAHAAIYDPVRDRLIVFGGYPEYKNDVWALDLSGPLEWIQLAPAGTLPEGRARHAAVYDPIGDRMVVFGGYGIDYSCFDDVWALSLSGTPEWVRVISTGTLPKARGRHSAIYDPIDKRMVIFGAFDCDYDYLNDVWSLSLDLTPAWTELLPTGTPPSVRSGQSAVYDPVRDRMVTFGGMTSFQTNDVWALAWGTSRCPTCLISSYDPTTLIDQNCPVACTVDFTVDTQENYSAVEMVTLEREVLGVWAPEDSLLAPLPTPPWTLGFDVDEFFVDGDHEFRVVIHCANSTPGVSDTVTVVAERGVVSAVHEFDFDCVRFTLGQNVPNPFNPVTRIRFAVPVGSWARLVVYDVKGRRVKTLIDNVVENGMTEAQWDGTDMRGQRVGSGIFFYRLIVGDKSLTKKMLLLK